MNFIIGIVVAVVLAPLIIVLAKRWRDGAAGFAAGSVVDPAGGIGGYITQLRTGSARGSDDGDDSGAPADSTGADVSDSSD